MHTSIRTVALLGGLLFAGVGCGASEALPEAGNGELESELSGNLSGPDALCPEWFTPAQRGEFIFENFRFGGNGRTCQTCHSETTGTVSPADAAARYARNPRDPLFRSIDADTGTTGSYTRLISSATIRIKIPLPSSVKLATDPGATSLNVFRGIPSTLNAPALDPKLMWDGREPNLTEQAKHAIVAHMQPRFMPTSDMLSDIAAYERTLFSSPVLRAYARGGPAPTLPPGRNASEQRGRAFFNPDGLCGMCHGGPMLDTETEFTMGAGGPGARFDNVGVSELNPGNLPMHQFTLSAVDPSTGELVSFPYEATDPGRAAITNDPSQMGMFKIPTLWNIKNTAPYFHDNSAGTLEAMVGHYSNFFAAVGLGELTTQQQADIVAYLKLL